MSVQHYEEHTLLLGEFLTFWAQKVVASSLQLISADLAILVVYHCRLTFPEPKLPEKVLAVREHVRC